MPPQQLLDTLRIAVCMCVCSVALVVSSSGTLWTVAHLSPLSMIFSRQEQWSGLLCPHPGDLSTPEIEPASPALQADCLLLSHWEAPKIAEQHKIVYVGIISCLLFLDSAELFFLGFP